MSLFLLKQWESGEIVSLRGLIAEQWNCVKNSKNCTRNTRKPEIHTTPKCTNNKEEKTNYIGRFKKKYLTDKICKPLEKGNSKPSFKHFRQKQNCQHPLATIKPHNGTVTRDSLKWAEALNCYFYSQFCADESIRDLPPLLVNDEPPEILPDKVRKLIHALKIKSSRNLTR